MALPLSNEIWTIPSSSISYFIEGSLFSIIYVQFDINQVNYDPVNNWLNQTEHESLDKLPRWIYGGYSGHPTGEIMGLTFVFYVIGQAKSS